MSFELIWQNNGVTCRGIGIFNSNDLVDSSAEIFNRNGFRQLNFILYNLSEISQLDISLADVAIASTSDEAASQFNPNIKQAIVANKTVIKEIVAIYDLMAIDLLWESKNFTSLQAAKAWLQID